MPSSRKRSAAQPLWNWHEQWDRTLLEAFHFDRAIPPNVVKRLAKIAGASGKKLHGDFDEQLYWATEAYWSDRSWDATIRPSSKQIKTVLVMVSEQADALRKTLSRMDERSLRYLKNELMGARIDHRPRDFEKVPRPKLYERLNGTAKSNGIADLIKHLEYLQNCAQWLAAQLLMPRKGRRADNCLSSLIVRLSDLYMETGGLEAKAGFSYEPRSKSYGGPFFQFVDTIIHRIDPKLNVTNNSLGDAIRRACGWRK